MPGLLDGAALDSSRIPFRVYMYWDQNPPTEIQENFDYHRQIQGLDYQVFNKDHATEWLYQNYGVEARGLFLGARHPAEAADFLRVHIMQLYGGWWLVAGGWWLVAGGWWLTPISGSGMKKALTSCANKLHRTFCC
ncbi:glycosyltransferase family 32 protein [Acetobacter nitrogenifigens]|nr:hypothetical protein [Acetobacter nitrogenifigens]